MICSSERATSGQKLKEKHPKRDTEKLTKSCSMIKALFLEFKMNRLINCGKPNLFSRDQSTA
jgi:hypothetical protein